MTSRICKEKIKDEKTLELKSCNKIIEDSRCPDKPEHMMKFKTGFCENGDHEGTKKKSPSGKSRRTCRDWKVCPCDCHTTFDRMFLISEMPRTLQDFSGYKVDHSEFWLPTLEDRVAFNMLSKSPTREPPIVLESPLPTVVPATMTRIYAATSSGRSAPGELEAWVLKQCSIWLVEQELFPCTPIYLSIEVGRAEGIKPPSVGAINAIFARWVNLGFAVVQKKPVRFEGFTPNGVALGLEGCKEKAKHQRKTTRAQQKRSSLR